MSSCFFVECIQGQSRLPTKKIQEWSMTLSLFVSALLSPLNSSDWRISLGCFSLIVTSNGFPNDPCNDGINWVLTCRIPILPNNNSRMYILGQGSRWKQWRGLLDLCMKGVCCVLTRVFMQWTAFPFSGNTTLPTKIGIRVVAKEDWNQGQLSVGMTLVQWRRNGKDEFTRSSCSLAANCIMNKGPLYSFNNDSRTFSWSRINTVYLVICICQYYRFTFVCCV